MLAITSVDGVPSYASVGINHIISLGGATQPRPDLRAWAGDYTFHRFVFDDISSPHETGPSAAILARLLAVYAAISPESNVLFHCMAGISRSTAACFLYMVSKGATYPQAYQTILDIRGVVQPNLYMIKLADKLMGRGGQMVEYVAHASGHPDWLTQQPYASP